MDYYDQIFDSPDSLPDRWMEHEFEQCTFRKLDLSRAVWTNASLINCRFEHCNLTRIDLKNTKLYAVQFVGCRLLHVDFSPCNAFGFHVDFQECILDYAAFLDRKLKKAQFVDCSLKEVHFVKCDLTGSAFRNCNLESAKFEANNLTQVDFASSYNLALDPDNNRLKKAKFSLHSLPGLLTKYDLVIKH